jgi:hypothetical protein
MRRPSAVRALAVLFAFTSCFGTISVADLKPRPNLPDVPSANPIAISLDEGILQHQTIEVPRGATVELETFRGDVKRGFLASFPGATQKGAEWGLTLQLIEPQILNLAGATVVKMKFKGTISFSGQAVSSFAGTADAACTDHVATCFREAIEHMFESIYAHESKELRSPDLKPNRSQVHET